MREHLWLPKEFLLAVHDRLLAEHGGSDARLRDEGLLESALERPKNLLGYGKPSIFELAASYAYGIAKNHPFVDGNKRTAFTAAATFLEVNGYELHASEVDATVMMLGLTAGAKSEAEFAVWLKDNSRRAK